MRDPLTKCLAVYIYRNRQTSYTHHTHIIQENTYRRNELTQTNRQVKTKNEIETQYLTEGSPDEKNHDVSYSVEDLVAVRRSIGILTVAATPDWVNSEVDAAPRLPVQRSRD